MHARMCFYEEEGGGGVTGSDGLSCLKGRVKEVRPSVVRKRQMVISVFQLLSNLCPNVWFHVWQLEICQKMSVKNNNNKKKSVEMWFLKESKSSCLSWVAANLMPHPCHRQLVHEGQLFHPRPLSLATNSVDSAGLRSLCTIWQTYNEGSFFSFTYKLINGEFIAFPNLKLSLTGVASCSAVCSL